MKLFEEIKSVDRPEPQPIEVDNVSFVKRNLMKSVDRQGQVYDAIENWLYSWQGGMSKQQFVAQLKRLDFNDDIALKQLQNAQGKRTIPLPPPPQMPVLAKSLVEQMLEDKYVAIFGPKFKIAIKDAVHTLRECGEVSVLSVEELILQFKTYADKGSSPQMIDKAIEADFLVIVDLEMPIHLEWHIREAIERIGRKRAESNKPIISTWCRFNDCNEFFKRFKVYKVTNYVQ